MRITITLVVMDVRGTDAVMQNAKSLMNGAHQVRVACIETNSHVLITQQSDQLHQLLRCRQIIGDVLQEQADAKRPGKRAQMFNRAERGFKFARIVGFITAADMLDEKTK